jgi:hypothetical protein
MLSPEIERWKKYLRYDPTRWLLEANDPSLLLWYQIEIAHRPVDAPGVLDTRERVLYSDAVQTLFAAQDELGFWDAPVALAHPYYRATLWNLALLGELGLDPASRRARNACEFVLQNFQQADGTFEGLNTVESGYLVHALAYFRGRQDARIARAAYALTPQAGDNAGQVAALWAWRPFYDPADSNPRADAGDLDTRVGAALELVLDHTLAQANPSLLAFPTFDPLDASFLLRVLAAYDCAADPRAAPLVAQLVAKQDDRARWRAERDLNDHLLTPFDPADAPSRWATLNALRVIVQLVAG